MKLRPRPRSCSSPPRPLSPSIRRAQVLQGTVAQDGLLPVHVDRRQGRILLSLPAPDAQGIAGRFVYVASLETGLGSAPIGLDRGLAGGSKIIVFRRVGRKILAEVENSRFRSSRRHARRAGRGARQLRLFDDLDGRHRRRDGRRPADRRRRELPHPRRDRHRPGGQGRRRRRVPPRARAQRRRSQFGPRLPAEYRARRAGSPSPPPRRPPRSATSRRPPAI